MGSADFWCFDMFDPCWSSHPVKQGSQMTWFIHTERCIQGAREGSGSLPVWPCRDCRVNFAQSILYFKYMRWQKTQKFESVWSTISTINSIDFYRQRAKSATAKIPSDLDINQVKRRATCACCAMHKGHPEGIEISSHILNSPLPTLWGYQWVSEKFGSPIPKLPGFETSH